MLKKTDLFVKEIKSIGTQIAARDAAEVVDTGADIAQVVMIVERYLADGLQLGDLVAVLEVQGIVSELIRDIGVAVSYVVEALSSETVQIAIDISNETKRRGTPGVVTNIILGIYFVAATSYRAGDMILDIGDTQKDVILSLIKGTLVVPTDVSGLTIK